MPKFPRVHRRATALLSGLALLALMVAPVLAAPSAQADTTFTDASRLYLAEVPNPNGPGCDTEEFVQFQDQSPSALYQISFDDQVNGPQSLEGNGPWFDGPWPTVWSGVNFPGPPAGWDQIGESELESQGATCADVAAEWSNSNGPRFSNLVVTVTIPGLATPTLTTQPSAEAADGTISDTATVSGGSGPTGTVTFKLFGPGNGSCTGNPVFTSSQTVNGDAQYTSDWYTPTATGTYQWLASYGGDTNNNPVAGSCPDSTETVNVTRIAGALAPTTTALSSSQNPSVSGQAVTFTAAVNSTSPGRPAGTVTFMDGASPLGSPVALPTAGSDQATLTTSTLSAGGHSITAVYSGDSAFATSTSKPPLSQSVTGCAAGQASHLMSATTNVGKVIGLFCVNPATGRGTYTQGSVSGTGTVAHAFGATVIAARGTNLGLAGLLVGRVNAFTESAPLSARGTFSLT